MQDITVINAGCFTTFPFVLTAPSRVTKCKKMTLNGWIFNSVQIWKKEKNDEKWRIVLDQYEDEKVKNLEIEKAKGAERFKFLALETFQTTKFAPSIKIEWE
nr:hypothetical protein [Abalone asfa-like virus]